MVSKKRELKRGQGIAILSTLLIGFLATAKGIIGFWSGSLVLLSDALHSASDLLPVFASWVGLKIAQRKADERFPYGYYKAENIATAIVSFLILYAGWEVFKEGLGRIETVSSIRMPLFALGISLLDAIVLYFFGHYIVRVGQEINSQTLVVIGQENQTHLFSSLAVFVGVLASWLQIPFIEGIITIIVAFLLLRIGFSALKDSAFALMDISPSRSIEEKVARAIEQVPGIEEFFDLRLRKSGPFIFGETKVGVRKFIDVQRAHQMADNIEAKIKKKIPQIESFTVHIEPFKSNFHHLVIPVLRKQKLNSPISRQFGRAPYFLFVNLQDKEIKGYYFLENPHQDKAVRAGLSAAKLITRQKSDTLITREIGEIAFHTLRDHLFDICQTKARVAQQAIDQFNQDNLKRLQQATKER